MPTKKCRVNSPEFGLSDCHLRPDTLREEPPAAAQLAQPATETLGYIKSHPLKNRETVRYWAARHDYCQVCLISERAACWRRLTGLQTHHIIKPGRSDEPCNLFRVCEQCHRIIEGERVPDNKGGYFPKLTLAHVLHCKRELDPHEYDPDRLTVLWRHRERKDGFDPLPRPQSLPEAFLEERIRWALGEAAPASSSGESIGRTGTADCHRHEDRIA